MRISPLGDSALRLELGVKIDESTHVRVQAACAALGEAVVPGIREVVPAYTTVTIHYNPAEVFAAGAPAEDLAGWLALRVEQAVAGARRAATPAGRTVEIPVCYGGGFGPDLARVAAQAGLSEAEVVRRHAAAHYRVALVGFSPGFPYLLGLPAELATPRHARPRTAVPAGSVAIAGEQTGVYPLSSPGGWNLIGRTTVRLFDPSADPPALLQTGDRVRFRAVDRATFDRAAANA
jgi:inhibitor of KinA